MKKSKKSRPGETPLKKEAEELAKEERKLARQKAFADAREKREKEKKADQEKRRIEREKIWEENRKERERKKEEEKKIRDEENKKKKEESEAKKKKEAEEKKLAQELRDKERLAAKEAKEAEKQKKLQEEKQKLEEKEKEEKKRKEKEERNKKRFASFFSKIEKKNGSTLNNNKAENGNDSNTMDVDVPQNPLCRFTFKNKKFHLHKTANIPSDIYSHFGQSDSVNLGNIINTLADDEIEYSNNNYIAQLNTSKKPIKRSNKQASFNQMIKTKSHDNFGIKRTVTDVEIIVLDSDDEEDNLNSSGNKNIKPSKPLTPKYHLKFTDIRSYSGTLAKFRLVDQAVVKKIARNPLKRIDQDEYNKAQLDFIKKYRGHEKLAFRIKELNQLIYAASSVLNVNACKTESTNDKNDEMLTDQPPLNSNDAIKSQNLTKNYPFFLKLDYDCDSEYEWENEPSDGEDLNDSGTEIESDDDGDIDGKVDEEDGKFFVPHGYAVGLVSSFVVHLIKKYHFCCCKALLKTLLISQTMKSVMTPTQQTERNKMLK